ncbi:hypothetical protein [Methylibium petroleiphilum]|uniref:Lipoprotein n=1 Tax=Methylibium petroleiphilum (strain ATCC BAA-1232 / LMG 22953 / PM1) TaxID=420662 RepID=A2SKA1_METPP|nr:hypothetical protein [Methylibium petroleiphilum]ABM95990.1 hypothetical protein Mpe_A3037 [Methylibium petroleiphilum PM1]
MPVRVPALALSLAVALAGCASSRPAEPGGSAAAQGNATVSRITYFAAWVDPPVAAAAVPTAVPKPAPAAKAKPPASGKRDKRASASAPAARSEAPAAPAATVDAGPKAPPQPRYEYTVELDGGGTQTVVGQRDLGLRVNDRVLVQGDSLAALPN